MGYFITKKKKNPPANINITGGSFSFLFIIGHLRFAKLNVDIFRIEENYVIKYSKNGVITILKGIGNSDLSNV